MGEDIGGVIAVSIAEPNAVSSVLVNVPRSSSPVALAAVEHDMVHLSPGSGARDGNIRAVLLQRGLAQCHMGRCRRTYTADVTGGGGLACHAAAALGRGTAVLA